MNKKCSTCKFSMDNNPSKIHCSEYRSSLEIQPRCVNYDKYEPVKINIRSIEEIRKKYDCSLFQAKKIFLHEKAINEIQCLNIDSELKTTLLAIIEYIDYLDSTK